MRQSRNSHSTSKTGCNIYTSISQMSLTFMSWNMVVNASSTVKKITFKKQDSLPILLKVFKSLKHRWIYFINSWISRMFYIKLINLRRKLKRIVFVVNCKKWKEIKEKYLRPKLEFFGEKKKKNIKREWILLNSNCLL